MADATYGGTMASWHSRAAALISDLRQEWLRTIIMVAAVALLAWLVLYPLAILFNLGFRTRDGAFTLANYRPCSASQVLSRPSSIRSLSALRLLSSRS